MYLLRYQTQRQLREVQPTLVGLHDEYGWCRNGELFIRNVRNVQPPCWIATSQYDSRSWDPCEEGFGGKI